MLLYIHIPYCDSKCHYCSFNSYVDKFDTRTKYMKALHNQLQFELERFEADYHSIESIFIGGGTPSTVSPELYTPIFDLLSPYIKQNAEITTEANPNSANKEWLSGMRNLGVNRVSFGVQSFDPQKLKALNRTHTEKQARENISVAYKLGFEHMSLDLIYNYKGDSEALLARDIDEAFALSIDHISAYELTIEGGTEFSKTPEYKQENDSLAFFVSREIKKRGFEQYEISNFGSHQSTHNKGYWKLKDYIGAGAGAVGFLKDTRYYPTTSIEQYIANPLDISNEKLSNEELLTEKIFLGLRSNIGVAKDILTKDMLIKGDILIKENKLIQVDNRYFNPNYFIADEIALFLLS